MTTETFTLVHVVISLVGIASGFVVIGGMLDGRRMDEMTALFLGATVLTSATGFVLPADRLLPSHVVAVLSLVVLAIAVVARYPMRLVGPWQRTYVVTAVIAQYLNAFVLVVQLFLRVPAMHALAPKGEEPPFAITQGIVLVLFVVLGTKAVRGFKAA